MKSPTVRVETQMEHHKAKWWRQHVARLSIDQLAQQTGYAARTIYLMELGCNAHGKKIQPWVWHRYKRTCAAVHFDPGNKFNWAP